MRIVSLVPSLSQTVAELGYRDKLVGITQFCCEPADLHRSAKIIGGTKDPDIETIKSLNPTHILANHEENRKEDVQALEELCSVLVTNPTTLSDTGSMLYDMKAFLGLSEFGTLADTIESLIPDEIKTDRKGYYFIWKDPYMVAGKDTYISDALKYLGIENLCEDTRYPTWDPQSTSLSDEDTLYLSSEPYPFRKRDVAPLLAEISCNPNVYKIDGRLMSWYGWATREFLLARKNSKMDEILTEL